MHTIKQHLFQLDNIILSPYTKQMVNEYKNWFDQDPELYQLTCTEPMDLKQFQQSQELFEKDESKCTCIIWLQNNQTDLNLNISNLKNEQLYTEMSKIGVMVGDVNLFYSEGIVEINLMIGKQDLRKQQIGSKVIRLIKSIVGEYLGNKLIAKIDESNTASLNFFLKHGFTVSGYISAFNEKELSYMIDQNLSFENIIKLKI